MALSYDMPADRFAELEKVSNLVHKQLVGERVIATEIFTGPRNRALHEAMDARLKEVEAAGGSQIHRTRIGRNSSCPCGSGFKFKKCCIDKAAIAD